MPKGLRGWTYKDIQEFLEDHGFKYKKEYNKGGSRRYFLNKGTQKSVALDYHSRSETKGEDVMKSIIRQSGIDRKKWREWARR